MTPFLFSALLLIAPPRDVIANNAFFYYADLPGAFRFYTEKLGLETVADYGFAKILQVADTSYLILVDATKGMHTAAEPKTVALALVTDELEEWYERMKALGVPMRNGLEVEPGRPPTQSFGEPGRSPGGGGRPHDGFVAIDPEGYFLEFERFNPHPENAKLLPLLQRAPSLRTAGRPKELGIKATILWMYYKDMEAIQKFYGDVMGFEQVVDQGWAKIYANSPTGFIGPVDEKKGMHRFTGEKGVTASWFTTDVDGWLEYLKGQKSFRLRTPEIMDESGKVRVFVGYDPENYFLEFDTFLDVAGNEKLMEKLKGTR
jgi:catechol 2,3-dioxygenase-like lactoylglutathione lyase family enzyme